jgi:coniferyl-aldehyde dehydrogenase
MSGVDTGADLKALLEMQRRAFTERPPNYSDRFDALRKLERAILKHQDDISDAIAADFGGRAAEETFTLELFPLLSEIRYACRHLKSWMAPYPASVGWQFWPARAKISYEPVGVVGILSSWNYPFFLTIAPLTNAIAAGNHALLKPSELSPATAALMKSIVAELYPPEFVSVVVGGPETASELTHLPLDHLLFTGSTRVGRLVMKAASENLVPVTLELGGKSPAAIHPDYPLRVAVKRILVGKLYNAGQTCVAPDYVLVPAGRKDEFIQEARLVAARMYPSLAGNRDYTRIIHANHYQRLSELLEEARARGAEIIRINPAGEICDMTNRVFPPTLVTNVRQDMAIMQEEIFGPILPIVEYHSIDEAVAFINNRPHPLAFYYFDNDSRRIQEIVSRVVAGGATVNDCLLHAGQPTLAFGGVGPSGMGRYHGFDGFRTFSHKKAVFFQRRLSPLSLLSPPYGIRTKQILKILGFWR